MATIATISVNYCTAAEVNVSGPSTKSVAALTLAQVLNTGSVAGGYLRLVGDTMTGPLTLQTVQDTSQYSAIHRNYLDTRIAAATGSYVYINGKAVDLSRQTRSLNFAGSTLSVVSAGEVATIVIPSPQETIFAGDAIDFDASTTVGGGITINVTNSLLFYKARNFSLSYRNVNLPTQSPITPLGLSDGTFADTVNLKRVTGNNVGGGGTASDPNYIIFDGVIPNDIDFDLTEPRPVLTLYWYSSGGTDYTYSLNYYVNSVTNAGVYVSNTVRDIIYNKENSSITVAGNFWYTNNVYGTPFATIALSGGTIRNTGFEVGRTGSLTNIPRFTEGYFNGNTQYNNTIYKTLSCFVPSTGRKFFALGGGFGYSNRYNGLIIHDTTNGPGAITTYYFYVNSWVYNMRYDGERYLYLAGQFNRISRVGVTGGAANLDMRISCQVARIDLGTGGAPELDVTFGINTATVLYDTTGHWAWGLEFSQDKTVLFVGGYFSSPYYSDAYFTALRCTPSPNAGQRAWGMRFNWWISSMIRDDDTAGGDSVLYIGGYFGNFTYQGVVNYIPYITAIGISKTTPTLGLTRIYSNWLVGLNHYVLALELSEAVPSTAVQPAAVNGAVLIGGVFSRALGNAVNYCVAVTRAHINPNSPPVRLTWDAKPDSYVYAIKRIPHTDALSGVLIGGSFTWVNGVRRLYYARLFGPQEGLESYPVLVQWGANGVYGSGSFPSPTVPASIWTAPNEAVVVDTAFAEGMLNSTTFYLNSALGGAERGQYFRVKVQRDPNSSLNNTYSGACWVVGATLDFNSQNSFASGGSERAV